MLPLHFIPVCIYRVFNLLLLLLLLLLLHTFPSSSFSSLMIQPFPIFLSLPLSFNKANSPHKSHPQHISFLFFFLLLPALET